MAACLNSSLVLRHILLGEETIEEAFQCGKVITSELLEIECRRVLHRFRLQNELNDEGLVEGTTVLAMAPSIKQKAAGSFPVVTKTLDALLLSSAWNILRHLSQ
jgi:hypothetical protein